jgi:hypothetical protein
MGCGCAKKKKKIKKLPPEFQAQQDHRANVLSDFVKTRKNLIRKVKESTNTA